MTGFLRVITGKAKKKDLHWLVQVFSLFPNAFYFASTDVSELDDGGVTTESALRSRTK